MLNLYSPHYSNTIPIFDVTPPLPTGHAVGLRHFHVVDKSRDDISTEKRQFMVSAFYPAKPDETAPRARLIDIFAPQCTEAMELLMRDSRLTFNEKNAAFARIESMTLRAQRDLESGTTAPCPVLIYYPGGASHRLSNAALCEYFANAGYIVFALDAPRDAPLVAFPNGKLIPLLPDNEEDYIWPRVTDVHFLLDKIEETDTIGKFIGTPDLSRVGMFGHSRGGYLSNICAVEDSRIRAAANMDGFLWGLWTQGTGLCEYSAGFQSRARVLKTPILRLRGDQGDSETARCGFEEERKDFGGDFIFITLDDYEHANFSTTPWLNGVAKNFSENTAEEPSHERAELLAMILTDFFDTYLLKRQPICLY